MIRICIILLLSSVVSSVVFASATKVEDIELTQIDSELTTIDPAWIDIANSSLDMAVAAIKDKYRELIKLKQKTGQYDAEIDLALNEFGEVNFTSTLLRIFVSSSMSTELLQYYHKQAKDYGGYLVINGLPEGSWHKLLNLLSQVCELNLDQNFDGSNCGILVDSQWFEEFDIKSVPSFVLSKSEGIIGEKVTFDKVSGNIGIRRALEIMADKGDLSVEARKCLKK